MDILHAMPPADLGVLALGLLIAGVVGGLLAGVLEIDGGIVMVPILYHVLATLGIDASVRMHIAIGTSLAAGVPAALSNAQGAFSPGSRPLPREWIAAFAGVALGSWLLAVASAKILAAVFGSVATLVVLAVVLGRDKRASAVFLPRAISWFALPFGEGVVDILTGIGGRTASVLRSYSQPRSTKNASALGAIISIPASLGAILAGWHVRALPPESLGYVNLVGFALIAPILLLIEPAGGALAHWLDLKRLRFAFAALIFFSTARMLWDALA